MTESDYNRLRLQIERRYRADLEALERLWGRLCHAPKSRRPRVSSQTQITTLVRKTALAFATEFDTYDVLRQVEERYASELSSRPSVAAISTALRRLANAAYGIDRGREAPLLEIVSAGGARKPARYRVSRQPVTAAELVEDRF